MDSVTSAPLENPPELSFASHNDIGETEKQLLRRIDQVALKTLRGCMQTVYIFYHLRRKEMLTQDPAATRTAHDVI